MNKCEDIRGRLSLYLDDELQGADRSAFEAHLGTCQKCQNILESERRFLEVVRASKPLHVAPGALRRRVRDILGDAPVVSERRPTGGVRSLFLGSGQNQSKLWRAVALAALAILVLPVGLWLFKLNKKTPASNTSEFALMAADTHLRHTRGQLPLELSTGVPEQISEWFSNKVKFTMKLPNYQDSSGQDKLYRLKGARLVGYKNDYAAYVAYEMKTRPISLVITSDTVAQPAGGEEIKAKGLTFHYDAIQGLKVITWSDRGLTYALVSDLEERGQQSCIVCHQGTKDQDFIEPLKPR